jgi:hypothetical protein
VTTIAWDGKELAADSQATSEGLVSYTVKIFKGDNYIMAYAGPIDEGYAFKAIMEGEAKAKDMSISKNFAALVWWDTGEIEEWYSSMIPVPVIDKYASLGSGSAIALAAMYSGATAKEAVELAKKLDAFTGGKIISYGWDKVKKGKKKKNEQLPASDLQEPLREVSGGPEQAGGLGGDSQKVHGLSPKTKRKVWTQVT